MCNDKSACTPRGHKGRDIKTPHEVKHEGYYVFDDSKKKKVFFSLYTHPI